MNALLTGPPGWLLYLPIAYLALRWITPRWRDQVVADFGPGFAGVALLVLALAWPVVLVVVVLSRFGRYVTGIR